MLPCAFKRQEQFCLREQPSGNAGSKRYSVITPSDANARGCQLSILAHEHPKELFKELQAAGVKCDFREPNVIRVAPTPLYNRFHDVWRFAEILGSHK
jgi:kynureninase